MESPYGYYNGNPERVDEKQRDVINLFAEHIKSIVNEWSQTEFRSVSSAEFFADLGKSVCLSLAQGQSNWRNSNEIGYFLKCFDEFNWINVYKSDDVPAINISNWVGSTLRMYERFIIAKREEGYPHPVKWRSRMNATSFLMDVKRLRDLLQYATNEHLLNKNEIKLVRRSFAVGVSSALRIFVSNKSTPDKSPNTDVERWLDNAQAEFNEPKMVDLIKEKYGCVSNEELSQMLLA